MNFRKAAIGLLSTSFFSLPLLADDASAKGVRLLVKFDEVRPMRGEVFCTLFDQRRGFPGNSEKAVQTVKVEVTDTRLTCDFGNLSPGVDAVAAIHDENGNGKLDTNMLGIPTEGWAVSNNIGPRVFGPPSFEAASLKLRAADEPVRIRMNFRY